MRPASPRYPVDRYLVESSKKFELVNVLDDEIWQPEPALRPEDEIILRKLHDMLQSTAEDLKMLSGELSKYHEPGIQIKTQPMPLDEEFNEKMHIEELVNAKFHGYKIVENIPKSAAPLLRNEDAIQFVRNNLHKTNVNTGVQVNTPPVKKPDATRNLGMTRTTILQIDESNKDTKNTKVNNLKIKTTPAVAYSEFSFQHVDPGINEIEKKHHKLQKQDMPSINIRSELREQKVLQLDIIPETRPCVENKDVKSNVAVIAIEHEIKVDKELPSVQSKADELPPYVLQNNTKNQPKRKVYKMSTCESSGSTNNISSDTQQKLRAMKHIKTKLRTSPKTSARYDGPKNKKNLSSKSESQKCPRLNLDEWKRKLNAVYGQTATQSKTASKSNIKKVSPKKSTQTSSKSNKLKNAEYIPYSKLTLGGVKVSDVEREIADIPNKNNMPLSPVLDKILTSRENSFHKDKIKFKETEEKGSPKILSTSDENLLQEVLDIEKTVSDTISKNFVKKDPPRKVEKDFDPPCDGSEAKDIDSYVDDFEDEKSDNTNTHKSVRKSERNDVMSSQETSDVDNYKENESVGSYNEDIDYEETKASNEQNITYTKIPNLSFKKSVDVFEFVHLVDTQETATQSNTTHKISLKETQTSPTSENSNIQPIINDLWPSIDPRGEVEKMFKLEKELIKKLIMEEYGDLFEKNIAKPSTSNDTKPDEKDKNSYTFQKNTQTSPAHVKSVMTSPTRTKTRTTSPFLALKVDHQTSPLVVITNEQELSVAIDEEEEGISINLSSPRFSLRLPQTSREVLSNLEGSSQVNSNNKNSKKYAEKSQQVTYRKNETDNESSLDGDKSSSSDYSSLGEVKFKLKRLTKARVPTISASSSTSTVSKYNSDVSNGLSGGILPLRSEGELSVGQSKKGNSHKSEGETSLGQL